MPIENASQVLEFWFSETSRPSWFARSDTFDALVLAELGPLHEQAAKGELDTWAATAQGCLALVILLDQVPRNIFRGSARSFATDNQALQLAKGAVDSGLDQALSEPERAFLYLPFQHSEVLVDQERGVAVNKALPNPLWATFAEKHRVIVARFGRFPHRNATLGRVNSPEEAEFLKEPGSSF